MRTPSLKTVIGSKVNSKREEYRDFEAVEPQIDSRCQGRLDVLLRDVG